MRASTVTVAHLTYDAAGENETEWTLTCRVTPPSPPSRWEPGDSGEVEILTATDGARTMSGDDWCDDFSISEGAIYGIGDLAMQALYDADEGAREDEAERRAELRRESEMGL